MGTEQRSARLVEGTLSMKVLCKVEVSSSYCNDLICSNTACFTLHNDKLVIKELMSSLS
jgi:hypothetical protein